MIRRGVRRITDLFSKKTRSKIMSKIKSKDTSPEKKLRKALWEKGYRYRIHYKLPGKPDIVFVSKKTAIFVDGCFWHKCPKCYIPPKSNKKYWLPKIEKNVERDKENTKRLQKEGWKVIRIWEHEINKQFEKTLSNIEKILKES